MDIPVILSRIAGVAIAILGLAHASANGFGIGSFGGSILGGGWSMFLSTALYPVALGILIIIAAEVLLRLGKISRKSH